MATEYESRTVIFRYSGGMASICSSVNVIPRSTSIANLSNTENSQIVGLFLVLKCKVIFPKILYVCFGTDESGRCISLSIVDSQSVGMTSFEISSGRAPVVTRQVIRCIVLFSALIEMRSKCADCPATAIIYV